jgi:hypothetical protein
VGSDIEVLARVSECEDNKREKWILKILGGMENQVIDLYTTMGILLE